MVEPIGEFHYPSFSRQSMLDSEELTALELAGRTAKKTNELITLVNGFQNDIDSREKSVDIATNRKLSATGDFSGTILGKAVLLVLAEIASNTGQLAFISDQFSDGATGLVIECGFFDDGDIKNNYTGGVW